MHRRDLLPVELGVVVLIEQEQLHDAGCEAGNAAQLAGIDRVDDMHDLEGRDADDFAGKTRVGHVAGVPAQEVVGDAPADRIELDPLPDHIAAGHGLVAVERQHLGRQHLQLQRDAETILRPPRPEPEEHLAGDEHLACRTALQAVEVREAFGIGLVGPIEPELLDLRP